MSALTGVPWKDLFQVGAWVVAIIGGLIAAFKAISEMSQSRELRAQELRWRKAQLAREILNSLRIRREFRDALLILDWSGREYKTASGQKEKIFWEDLPGALVEWKEPMGFTTRQMYIRDCFDALYDGMDHIEHYLRTGLLDFEDIKVPMEYYVTKLLERGPATLDYMTYYGFVLARSFLARYTALLPTKLRQQSTPNARG